MASEDIRNTVKRKYSSGPITYKGESRLRKDWAKHLGVPYGVFNGRLLKWGISEHTFTAGKFTPQTRRARRLAPAPDAEKAAELEAVAKQARIDRLAQAKQQGDYYRAVSLHYAHSSFPMPAQLQEHTL